MQNYFETNNLTDLIEITARNIKSVHKLVDALEVLEDVQNVYSNVSDN